MERRGRKKEEREKGQEGEAESESRQRKKGKWDRLPPSTGTQMPISTARLEGEWRESHIHAIVL